MPRLKNNTPVRFRPMVPEDIGFVFNSWLKSYRKSHFSRLITTTIYFAEHHKILEKLIKNCKTIIACNVDDPSQIYGYINGAEIDGFLIINYLYTKHSFRNMGIGRELLNVFNHDPSKASIYTHHTRVMDILAPKFNLVFHPYIMINEFLGDDNEGK